MGVLVYLPMGKGEEERAPLENVKAIENLFSLVTKNKKVIQIS